MRSPLLPITLLVCVAVAALGWLALSQPAGQTQPAASQALAQPASAASAPVTPLAGGVDWSALTDEQRKALGPLTSLWPTLHPEHQRKWIALTHNFNHMSAAAQATLQGRMSEWARLTPTQRTQARLNFGETRRMSADKKRAKWEEYQALPATERERLAHDRPKPPVGAAPALRPTPADRIVHRPATRMASASSAVSLPIGPASAALEQPAPPPLEPSAPASEPSW
jgi:hypothetical protein